MKGFLFAGNNDFKTHKPERDRVFNIHRTQWRQRLHREENLWQAAVGLLRTRRLVKQTGSTTATSFFQPTEPLTDEFKNDCLIWMLFNGSNLTAGADGLEWNGKTWSLVNHFIPFTEAEVGAPDRFESDFMVQYLADKPLSAEAQAVLDPGRTLWQAYFAYTDARTVRDEYKLNRPDVGWYANSQRAQSTQFQRRHRACGLGPFESAYQALTEKLQPQVFSLGFLR